MRLVSYVAPGGECRCGVMRDGEAVDLAGTDARLPSSMRELLEGGDEALQRARAAAGRPDAVRVADPLLSAPILDPEKIICIGMNYRDHADEQGVRLPKEPVVFSKFASALVGPGEPIRLPAVSPEVDFEAELVLVIGKTGRRISRERAFDHLAGYTIGNDVSARDWQIRKEGRQWLLGKTFDTFAPIGPAIVTKDDVPDPQNLPIRFRLNGKIMQDSCTSQMVFSIGELVEYVSQVFTLSPGDLIFTGTPAGVGFARKPPVFLQLGDVCEVEIDGLGSLRNRCLLEQDEAGEQEPWRRTRR